MRLAGHEPAGDLRAEVVAGHGQAGADRLGGQWQANIAKTDDQEIGIGNWPWFRAERGRDDSHKGPPL